MGTGIIGSQSLEQLRLLSRENSWATIAVRLPKHHSAMRQVLFERAIEQGKSIRYLAKSFNSAFYDPAVVRSLETFLDQGGDMNLLIWDEVNVGGEKEEEIRELAAKHYNLRLSVSGTRKMGDQIRPSFVVDDSVDYRFACHPYYGDTKFSESNPIIHAVAQFGGKPGVAEATKYFDAFWNACPGI